MDQHYYRSASNSLLARTADRTPKTFALQGDPSRSTVPPSSKRSPYIVSPADRDVTWNDLISSSQLAEQLDQRSQPSSSEISYSPYTTIPRLTPVLQNSFCGVNSPTRRIMENEGLFTNIQENK
ncbi:hypothetical protein AVEN_26079-1 [Araneus ventricosus]|uniref:Uncharacterized protein n=1 Tax=Araneus ventricosus TaxID=182803 RepID=A0A4Y2M6G1_ARAVE|nr:hypothetical protein AVEN_26079-1 [Araneus ventricosus]